MPDLFRGLFDTEMTQVISVQNFLICLSSALAIGLLLALCYAWRSRCTRSFVATMALLPAIVCVVIMMVNGNVGAGVAVAGAFSLVRFRSVPGSAREIGALFVAMSLLALQFAPMISVVVAFASLIPLFGIYLGALPGFIALLFIAPAQAVVFAEAATALIDATENAGGQSITR